MKEIYTLSEHTFETDDKYNVRNITTKNKGGINDIKGLDKGWSWVVLLASFCTCCVVGANNYGTGIIHKILLERYGASNALTSLSGSLQLALMCLAAPVWSIIVNKYSCRVSLISAGLLFVIAYLSTAFAPSMSIAVFTCGILAGTAAGLGYSASIVAINYNFMQRANFALGLTLSGIGVGIFAFAPLMEIAYEYYGSTGFFITMATLSMNIVTFGTICFPSKLEIYTHMQRKLKEKSAKKCQNKPTMQDKIKMYWYAVAKRPIFLLCISMFAFSCGTDLIFLHLPTIVISSGFTSKSAALIVSLNGALSVVGRLLTGLFSNFHNKYNVWLFVVCLLTVSTSTVVFAFILTSFKGHLVYAIILGLFFGSCYVLVSPVCLQFLNITYAATAIGLVLFFSGAGSTVGPFLAGIILDAGGTYKHSVITAGGFVFVAMVFAMLLTKEKRTRTGQDDFILLVKYSRCSSLWYNYCNANDSDKRTLTNQITKL